MAVVKCESCGVALTRDEAASATACPCCGHALSRLGSARVERTAWERPRAPEMGADPVVVPCPECKQPSDSIKCYRLGYVFFLLVAGGTSFKNELGCPSCIRTKIALFCLINVLTANLLWPIIILPMTVIYLLMSCTRGHSRAVRQQLGISP